MRSYPSEKNKVPWKFQWEFRGKIFFPWNFKGNLFTFWSNRLILPVRNFHENSIGNIMENKAHFSRFFNGNVKRILKATNSSGTFFLGYKWNLFNVFNVEIRFGPFSLEYLVGFLKTLLYRETERNDEIRLISNVNLPKFT